MLGCKVSIVCESFYPERSAVGNRVWALCKALREQGAIVSVVYLTECLDFNEGHFLTNGIKHFPVRKKPYSKSNLLSRAIKEIKYSLKLVQKARLFECDLVIVSVPMLMLLPVASIGFLSSRYPCKVLDVRDLMWDYLTLKDGFFSKISGLVLKSICELSIRSFDLVVTATSLQQQAISKFYGNPVYCIKNGIDRESFEKLCGVARLDSGSRDGFVVTYAGSIGFPQNLSTIIDAAVELEKLGVDVLVKLVGSGPQKEELEAYCKTNSVSNVLFIDSVDFDALLHIYENTDILYGQLTSSPSLASAEPTKLFEYVSTGKPVVFGAHGASLNLALKFENVSVVRPDDVQDLVSSLIGLNFFPENVNRDIEMVRKNYIRDELAVSYVEILSKSFVDKAKNDLDLL